MDIAKYRNLFLEEATEHLSEMSRSLLLLEKESGDGEAIDTVFRMAHSIKGMAGSLGYDSITELSHLLEDRMDLCRQQGRVPAGEHGIGLLFRGLEGLERLVGFVRETGEPPPPDEALITAVREAPVEFPEEAESGGDPPKKA
ncbi:MAG: Hpt domain-containing protein [Myxococcota bacterium]|nr:Hpt domain-containing protein [Myxococcota bacterium]